MKAMTGKRKPYLNDPWHTAIHEAGHAVIARVLRLRCGEVTMVPNEAEGYAGYSHTGDPWDTIGDWERFGHYRDRDIEQAVTGYILVQMAGLHQQRSLWQDSLGSALEHRPRLGTRQLLGDFSDRGVGFRGNPS